MKNPIVIRIIPNTRDNGLTNEINSIVKPLQMNKPIIVILKNVRKIPETSIITHWRIILREGLVGYSLDRDISLFMIRKMVNGIIGNRQGDKAT
jgi:hypothetical protein